MFVLRVSLMKLPWDPWKILLYISRGSGCQNIKSNCPWYRAPKRKWASQWWRSAVGVCVQRHARESRELTGVGERRRPRAHTWTMPRPHFSASFMIAPSSFSSRLLPHVLIMMRLSVTNMLLSLRAHERRTHQWHWHWLWHGCIVPKMASCGKIFDNKYVSNTDTIVRAELKLKKTRSRITRKYSSKKTDKRLSA